MSCAAYLFLIFLLFILSIGAGIYIDDSFDTNHPYMISFFTFLIIFFIIRAIFRSGSGPSVRVHRYQKSDFLETFLILAADVIKSDGHFKRSELDYLRNYLTQNLGPTMARQAIIRLQEIMQENYNLTSVCNTMRTSSNIHERLLVV